jgi:hypothetical protein
MTDDRPDPAQIEVLRRMTPEQRWRAARQLYWSLRRHKAAFLRAHYPEWSDERVAQSTPRMGVPPCT